MTKHVSDSVLCPRCRGDLSSAEHQGQATCPHCKAPVLFAGADGHDTECLALPVQFAEFITDGVIARRGGEVILHGWHRSGDPEVVIKLWPQSGTKPPKQDRHPNVVRSLKSGTEVGFDFQVYEWAEGKALNSASDLLTPSELLSPREAVSPKLIQPTETVATVPDQSEPTSSPMDSDAMDMPSFGATWRSRFSCRLHEGLIRGLGSNGLGCSMPMSRFLADGVCVSLYAAFAMMIAIPILSESMAAVVGAIMWLSWPWFWLRHYRCFLGWKTHTTEMIAAAMIVLMSLMNGAGFWFGVFAAVIFDTCLVAIVVWRTLHCRFGQRSQPTSSTPHEPEKPKPADMGFPRTLLGGLLGGLGLAIGSVVVGYVTNVISDGKMTYEYRKGFVPVKTAQDRQVDLARFRAILRVSTLTVAISKTTDPHEQAMLYQQRAQAHRELGHEDLAHTDEGRAQQIQLRNTPHLSPR